MTQVMEGVVWDHSLLFDQFKYYGYKNLLKTNVGKIRTVVVTRDRPYFFSSKNFTNPKVKRMNSFTYCGLQFYVPKEGTNQQILELLTCTDNKSSLLFRGRHSFSEWNTSFDQNEN